jgi:hypothetical protein
MSIDACSHSEHPVYPVCPCLVSLRAAEFNTYRGTGWEKWRSGGFLLPNAFSNYTERRKMWRRFSKAGNVATGVRRYSRGGQQSVELNWNE